MPRLGDAQRRFDRLQVAQLADQDDVGVLAQRRAQRVGEALRVLVHLALVDQAALVRVDELDRVLDREDVLVALGIDLVDHRGQRGRLAAARRAGDEHQAARPIGERRENRRQPQFIEPLDLLRNDTVDRGDRTPLVEDVASEPREAADAEREVQFERLFEPFLLRVGEHAVCQPLRFRGTERRQIERLQLAMHANLRRRLRGDMQVGSAHFDERL